MNKGGPQLFKIWEAKRNCLLTAPQVGIRVEGTSEQPSQASREGSGEGDLEALGQDSQVSCGWHLTCGPPRTCARSLFLYVQSTYFWAM